MKKRLYLLMATLSTCTAVWAAPVDSKLAAQVAQNFWVHTLHATAPLGQQAAQMGCGTAYLFASPAGGWVMVAADDAARPILAYSQHSTLDPQRLPAAVGDFMAVYQKEIEAAREAKLPRHQEWDDLAIGIGPKDEEAVGPLLTTAWFQTAPYNQLCPTGCMTGCEATAMAQVLKYWNYPAFGEGSHSYNDPGSHGVQSADFAGTRYDWDNMPDRLNGSTPAAQRTAVATLMYHCGVAVDMSYGVDYSGAVMTSVAPALTTYFHYSTTARYKTKGSLTNEAWTDTLIAELRYRRPIVYGGSGPAGGHVFVCDGFDSRHYLHFNLGEAGEGDGYYQIGAINYGGYSFNGANDCIMGIEPAYGIYCNTAQMAFGRESASQQAWVSTSDTSSDNWTITTSDNWIEVSGGDFDHLGQITVSVLDNGTGQERRGTVTLRQGDHSSTMAVMQAAYDPATDYCPLTVEMGSSRNEAWAADAHLTFESPSGLVYGMAQHTVGRATSSAQVQVAPHDVMVRWHSGDGRDRYISYKIKNQYGETLVEVSNAFLEGGDQLLVWPCAHLGMDATSDTPVVTVSPNPTSGTLSIEAEGLQRVELFDLEGRRVKSGNGKQMDVSSLAKGLYILHATTERGTVQKKVVKE